VRHKEDTGRGQKPFSPSKANETLSQNSIGELGKGFDLNFTQQKNRKIIVVSQVTV
jgi:hypothetical protein